MPFTKIQSMGCRCPRDVGTRPVHSPSASVNAAAVSEANIGECASGLPLKSPAIRTGAASVRDACRGQDLVFHLGALIAIPYSYVHPREVVETNILGTLNVLEGARAHGVGRVVHTSTSEVYGTAQRVPIDEDHPRAAQSPYAATKTGADQLARAYHRSFGTPVATLRPFNTYGPRQSDRAVIPTIVAVAFLMEQRDATVIVTAIPSMADSLGTTPLRMNLAVTAYVLALAMFIPLSGWLADRHGARRIFALSLLVFTLGSVLCGFATSFEMLVATRVIQGFGGAMMMRPPESPLPT